VSVHCPHEQEGTVRCGSANNLLTTERGSSFSNYVPMSLMDCP